MAKTIRTMGQPHVVKEVQDIRRPACPVHREEMKYEPALGRWKCPELGCKFTATRKADADEDTEKVTPRKPTNRVQMPPKPLQQHGPKAWTLTIDTSPEGDDRYWLTHESVSFAMEVTDYVETVIDDQTNTVTLCLLFHDVKRV